MIKYFLFLFIILTLISIPLMAEDFYTLLVEAEGQYERGNFEKASEIYKEILKEDVNVNARYYYIASCSCALSKDLDYAFEYLYSAIDRGWLYTDMIKEDIDLENLHSDSRWSEILLRLEKIEKNFNKPLKEELELIYIEDQKYRNMDEINHIRNEFGIDSPEMNAFFKEMEEHDRKNLKRVEGIIKDYGWPGISLAGPEGARAVFLVIQHSSLEVQEKYLPLLAEAVEAGEADFSNLVLLQDRVLMGRGEKQIYGSQVIYNEENGQWELYPVEDEENVDKRREEKGLEPLHIYLEFFGIDYK